MLVGKHTHVIGCSLCCGAASGSPTDAALRDTAADVRKSHQPNEWDSCVACRHEWPCDAEMLAELVETRALRAASGSPEPVLDVERLADEIAVIQDRLEAAFNLMTPDIWAKSARSGDGPAHGIAQHVWFALEDCRRLVATLPSDTPGSEEREP